MIEYNKPPTMQGAAPISAADAQGINLEGLIDPRTKATARHDEIPNTRPDTVKKAHFMTFLWRITGKENSATASQRKHGMRASTNVITKNMTKDPVTVPRSQTLPRTKGLQINF